MSKSKKSMQRDWYEDDENDFSMIAKDRERRKNKRLTNAEKDVKKICFKS